MGQLSENARLGRDRRVSPVPEQPNPDRSHEPPVALARLSISSSVARCAARHEEIDRDGRLVTEALLDALRRIASSPASHLPGQIWARVGDAVEASRAAYGALNNARITLRGMRYATHCDSAPLPASLRHFRHHGNYRGAFRSMAELGNCLRGALGITTALSPAERTTIARQLHLCGDIWTLEHEGAVHVFGRPGCDADLILASERPEPSLNFTPLEALRL